VIRKAKAVSTTSLRNEAFVRGITQKFPGLRWKTGSAVTWKYPSCILKGDNSIGEFYSVAVTNNYQQADTGTKMIHIGKKHKIKNSIQRCFLQEEVKIVIEDK
jgi:Fe-S cluster assembly scaffold protein SufB